MYFYDLGHDYFDWLRKYFQKVGIVPLLCQINCLGNELAIFYMIFESICGKTFRAVLAMMIALSIRLATRVVTFVPHTSDGLWTIPENTPYFFSLPEKYDTFFSARIVVSTILLCECIYKAKSCLHKDLTFHKIKKLAIAALSVILFILNVVNIVALRTSWSFDIIVSVIVARYSTIIAYRYAPFIDAFSP